MLKQLRAKIEYYNKPLPLQDHLVELIGNKKEAKIADLGSGPFPITGQLLEGVKVEIYPSDKQDFNYFWRKYMTIPTFPIDIQDMENLTYEDNTFDIVNCVNALDHTRNALKAVKEMIRVLKPGGWIYIDCALYQKTFQRKKHYWDATESGSFFDGTGDFSLKDLGFTITLIDNHGERQYNHMIATYLK